MQIPLVELGQGSRTINIGHAELAALPNQQIFLTQVLHDPVGMNRRQAQHIRQVLLRHWEVIMVWCALPYCRQAKPKFTEQMGSSGFRRQPTEADDPLPLQSTIKQGQ